eukprot:CAMPEP_0206239080 /NCGR_PEP_ID=MMETSP0047_2-20121206/15180_1 /ASSEMBLY_ACC=CAM_ASM_000192 /TAXON_ID=195065 /ORGANISM="Chroomonas mesostigmatica_cf, Strain CCMP1168" /LENGTH=131 /DNA_ID=CAMNT_0053663703 /DNA_START=65 /DNA_END=456 /DNA_ORIENTATION=+
MAEVYWQLSEGGGFAHTAVGDRFLRDAKASIAAPDTQGGGMTTPRRGSIGRSIASAGRHGSRSNLLKGGKTLGKDDLAASPGLNRGKVKHLGSSSDLNSLAGKDSFNAAPVGTLSTTNVMKAVCLCLCLCL